MPRSQLLRRHADALTCDQRAKHRSGDCCEANPKKRKKGGPALRGTAYLSAVDAVAQFSSESRFRVRIGSTGMPGPIVVEKVTFLR